MEKPSGQDGDDGVILVVVMVMVVVGVVALQQGIIGASKQNLYTCKHWDTIVSTIQDTI